MIANFGLLGTNTAVQAVVTMEQQQRFADALTRVAGDADLLVAIASLVVEDAPQIFADMKRHVATGALADAAATGHQLKGMLSTFETKGSVLVLQELIDAARSGNVTEAKAILLNCESGIQRLMDEIRNLSDGNSATPDSQSGEK